MNPQDSSPITVTGQGPAVVALHSSLSSRRQWRHLAARLEGNFRLIAVDLAGYGVNQGVPAMRPWRLDAECSLVQAALASVLPADEPFHLVGHSFGGASALRMAALDSARVLSLTLFEPTAFHLLPQGHERTEIEGVALMVASMLGRGAAMQAAEVFIDFWNGAGTFAALRADKRAMLGAQIHKVALDFDALLNEPLDLADYRHLSMPVCLLKGATSPACTRTLVDLLRRTLPQAMTLTTDGGHMAPLTHGEATAALMASFLEHAAVSA